MWSEATKPKVFRIRNGLRIRLRAAAAALLYASAATPYGNRALGFVLLIVVEFGPARQDVARVILPSIHGVPAPPVSVRNFCRAYRVAAASTGCCRCARRNHKIPPTRTSKIEMSCVPLITPLNTEPRSGSSRRNSRKNRATP